MPVGDGVLRIDLDEAPILRALENIQRAGQRLRQNELAATRGSLAELQALQARSIQALQGTLQAVPGGATSPQQAQRIVGQRLGLSDVVESGRITPSQLGRPDLTPVQLAKQLRQDAQDIAREFAQSLASSAREEFFKGAGLGARGGLAPSRETGTVRQQFGDEVAADLQTLDTLITEQLRNEAQATTSSEVKAQAAARTAQAEQRQAAAAEAGAVAQERVTTSKASEAVQAELDRQVAERQRQASERELIQTLELLGLSEQEVQAELAKLETTKDINAELVQRKARLTALNRLNKELAQSPSRTDEEARDIRETLSDADISTIRARELEERERRRIIEQQITRTAQIRLLEEERSLAQELALNKREQIARNENVQLHLREVDLIAASVRSEIETLALKKQTARVVRDRLLAEARALGISRKELNQQITTQLGGSGGGGGPFGSPLDNLGFGRGFRSVLQFGLPSLLLFGGISLFGNIIEEAEELERILNQVRAQLRSIGDESSFGRVRDEILEIAAETGVEANRIAETFQQLRGAFRTTFEGGSAATLDTAKALEETARAMELVKVTGLELEEVVDSLTAITLNFSDTETGLAVTMEDVGDKTIGLQERFGVLARETIEFTGDLAPVGAAAQFTSTQLAALGAAAQQVSGQTGGSLAERFGRILPELPGRAAEIIRLLQQFRNFDGRNLAAEASEAFAAGDIAQVFTLILEVSAQANDEQRQFIASLVGGRREAQALAGVLSRAPALLREFNDEFDDTGKQAEFFSELQETVANTQARFGEIVRQLGDAFFESGLADLLVGLLETASDLVSVISHLVELFGDLGRLVIGALGPIGDLALAGIGPIAQLTAAIVALNVALNALSGTAIFGGLARGLGAVGIGATGGLGVGAVVAGGAVLSSFFDLVEGANTAANNFEQQIKAELAQVPPSQRRALLDEVVRNAPDEVDVDTPAALKGPLTDVFNSTVGRLFFDTPQDVAEEVRLEQLQLDFTDAVNSLASQTEEDFNRVLGQVRDILNRQINEDFVQELNDELLTQRRVVNEAGLGTEDILTLDPGRLEEFGVELPDDIEALLEEDRGLSEETAARVFQLIVESAANQNEAAQQFITEFLNEQVEGGETIFDSIRSALGVAADQELELQSQALERIKQVEELRSEFESGKISRSQFINELQLLVDASEGVFDDADTTNEELQEAARKVQEAEDLLIQELSDRAREVIDLRLRLNREAGGGPEQQLNIVIEGLRDTDLSAEERFDLAAEAVELSIEAQNEILEAIEDPIERLNAARDGVTLDPLVAAVRELEAFSIAPETNQILGQVADLVGIAYDELVVTVANTVAETDKSVRDVLLNGLLILRDGIRQALSGLRDTAQAIGSIVGGIVPDVLGGTGLAEQFETEFLDQAFPFLTESYQVIQDRIDELEALGPGFLDGIDFSSVTDRNAILSAQGDVAADAERAAEEAQRRAEEAREQARALALARLALESALAGPDALAQAEIEVRRAEVAIQFADGEAERLEAQAQLIEARRGVAEAINDIGNAERELLIAQAEAAGRTVEAARLNLEETRQTLEFLASQGAGAAELDRAEAAVVAAEANYRDAQLNERRELLSFLEQTGQITTDQLIAGLEALLQIPTLTAQQRRELLLEIQNLKDQINSDLSFNIPSELRTPTLFEVRRFAQSGAGGLVQDNRNITFDITITDPEAVDKAVNKIRREMDAEPRFGSRVRLV